MPLRLPPVTLLLIVVNAGAFLLQLLAYPATLSTFALWPLGEHRTVMVEGVGYDVGFELWQVVSYAFLHGNLPHLLLNLFAMFMFGGPIERLWGSRPFLIYYLVCVLGAALAQLVTLAQVLPPGELAPTLGASGGVFGLLLAFAMMYPRERILLLFPPIPMPAWLFVIVYGAVELYLGLSQAKTGIAHFAHLGGMAAGFVLIQYWRGRLPWKPRRVLTR
jgi:membrane associated rhomboid family serine protease